VKIAVALLTKKFIRLSEPEFKEVYSRSWKRLYGIAYSYLREKAAAQELVQEVFIKLWQKRDELAHVNNLDAYLFRSMKYKVYEYFDRLASQERLKKHSLENFQEEIHPTEEVIAYEETLDMINQELEKLPVTTRTIFRMSRFERYSNKEIARQMHVSAKAVEYHISQASKRLRLRLSHTLLFVIIPALLH